MQRRDLLDERQAQPRALLLRVRARQGIELLEDLFLRVVGDAGAVVAHADARRCGAWFRSDSRTSLPAGEKSIALSSRLLTARRSRKASPSTAASSGASTVTRMPRGAAASCAALASSSSKGLSATVSMRVQRAARLQRGQLHHAVHHLLDAAGLARDVGQEALARLGSRHVGLLQQLGGAADRRQRALHLVRERLHIVGHVVAPGQRVAHLVVGRAQHAQRAPAQARQAQRPLRAHIARVVGDQAEGPHQPDRDDHGQQQHGQHRDQPHIERLARAPPATNWPKLCVGLADGDRRR